MCCAFYGTICTLIEFVMKLICEPEMYKDSQVTGGKERSESHVLLITLASEHTRMTTNDEIKSSREIRSLCHSGSFLCGSCSLALLL
jgi:hypothetical protein